MRRRIMGTNIFPWNIMATFLTCQSKRRALAPKKRHCNEKQTQHSRGVRLLMCWASCRTRPFTVQCRQQNRVYIRCKRRSLIEALPCHPKAVNKPSSTEKFSSISTYIAKHTCISLNNATLQINQKHGLVCFQKAQNFHTDLSV